MSSMFDIMIGELTREATPGFLGFTLATRAACIQLRAATEPFSELDSDGCWPPRSAAPDPL